MKMIFQNEMQKALMEYEMAEQIADGYWKNYSTEYEWKYFNGSEAVIVPNSPSVLYIGYLGRPFNFLNKNLYEIFGERMKLIYAISMIAPNELNIMLQYFSHDGIETIEEFDLIEARHGYRINLPPNFRDKFIETMPTITDKMVKKELKALNLGFKM